MWTLLRVPLASVSTGSALYKKKKKKKKNYKRDVIDVIIHYTVFY